jgi:hypothetical protein
MSSCAQTKEGVAKENCIMEILQEVPKMLSGVEVGKIDIGGIITDVVDIIGKIVKKHEAACADLPVHHPVGCKLGKVGDFVCSANLALDIACKLGTLHVTFKFPDPDKKYITVEIN